ncbi:MAG: hypothetical protein A2X12_02445 [Bacteroidetes bacterium GWE2_29_8]|nr:MAG: hypothetical protein A2X12_02445 [Bacteroidetes bacterium GWE2_29_8]OFY14627.1 MAG: hypothetical protein A2X02_06035 [Bacteroidetes bacterium GWF2_29_10]
MNTVKIEVYKKGQEVIVYQLIKRVYDEFVSFDYSDEGNQFFYDWIQPSKIASRQENQVNILLAFVNIELVGMIEIRDNKNISLLFVDKIFQGQGIAKKLFKKALKNCIKRDPKLDKFYVHAFPYSTEIYKKLGFKETDIMQEQFGIKYLPMEIDII